MKKVQVSVKMKNDNPCEIVWSDGRVFKIGKVLFCCEVEENNETAIRYTVVIGKEERYLYQSKSKWYVIAG